MKGGNNRTALTMNMKEVGYQWPLIRYIVDDPAYYSFYKESVKEFIENTFTPAKMSEYISKHKAVLLPNFTGTGVEAPPYSSLPNPQSFVQAVSGLERYINDRHAAVSAFIKN